MFTETSDSVHNSRASGDCLKSVNTSLLQVYVCLH